jgi:glyoxylate reductase
MGRVLVTRRLPDGGLDPLADHELIGPNADDAPFSHGELVAHAGDVDAIVAVLTDRIDADVLVAGAAGGRLRVVANVAVGYDNIDVRTAREQGVVVCNTPGVLDETTADLAFTLILAASRLVHEAEADLRSARWEGWGITQYLGRDVHDATLGIVGYGRIGRAVARRAAGFGMRVLHHARGDTGAPGYLADLDELLATADIVSLHVPGGEPTHHLLDARRLALMKPTAVLVNTARGSVVDEAALADALHENRLFAAGLDVFEREPAVHPRLLDAPRTVLLPHIGSASHATRTRMAALAASAVATVLNGGMPPNVVRS